MEIDMMKEPDVMVYLMTGFLDSGKTQFLNFTLSQDYFQIDGKTLLILCEEGEEEYDPRELLKYGVVIETVEDKEDLTEVFRLVNNYLDPKGLFIFDFNTDYKYRDMIGETVIAEDREDVSFIWFNEYDEESQLNDIDLKVFVQEDGDCYRKFQEEHIQRGYSLQEIKQMLEESGLVFLQAFDEYSNQEPRTDSGRIVVVAQENGKEKQEETE